MILTLSCCFRRYFRSFDSLLLSICADKLTFKNVTMAQVKAERLPSGLTDAMTADLQEEYEKESLLWDISGMI